MKRIMFALAAMLVVLGPMAGPAAAGSGHFIKNGKNTPTCTQIDALTVSCSGKVAGLGGDTFEIRVTAQGEEKWQCRNPGGNVAPGQNKAFEAVGSTGDLPTPRNGQYVFSGVTSSARILRRLTGAEPTGFGARSRSAVLRRPRPRVRPLDKHSFQAETPAMRDALRRKTR